MLSSGTKEIIFQQDKQVMIFRGSPGSQTSGYEAVERILMLGCKACIQDLILPLTTCRILWEVGGSKALVSSSVKW